MSTPTSDPYLTLGVSKDAPLADIKQAHRKLVLKCHPDKVQEPTLKAQKQNEFQLVQEAYEILSDEIKRAKYDDKVRLAELRAEQSRNKANSSAARSPKVVEIRTVDPSMRAYKTAPPQPPIGVKIRTDYSRSYEEDRPIPRYFDTDIRIPPRREATYSDKPSKREIEKEREKEKERERRKAKKERDAEEARRLEKAAKKEEKRKAEKQRAKDVKRGKEDKRRERDAYIEEYDPPRVSSKTYERRERSNPREEPPREADDRYTYARAYIQRSQTTNGPERSASYYHSKPAVPTPPPAGASPYVAPPDDEEIRRSSARPRRGSSSESPRHRSSYRKTSKEPLEEVFDPEIVQASPAARDARRNVQPDAPRNSPPRGIHRHNTMPLASDMPSRAALPRAYTYNDYGASTEVSGNRGRHRSKHTAQSPVEMTDSEEEPEPQRRSKHRSSRRAEPASTRYYVDTDSRSQPFTRRLNPEHMGTPYYDHLPRPAHPTRQATYHVGGGPAEYGGRIKMSKNYGHSDVQFSNYAHAQYESMPTRA